ncbi:DUF456 domain-containing protein [Thioalkalivibrio sp. XN279]|uniref:DUF456 domain-containing protein n=1 Tax=Thioalkalivibrio sp. XN279 TaxID=2714953 RepID=UPI00140ADA90|nr:DUF456 domain-containing protein [Thioalkalivibrio sp. XN279]NHA14191.1 DUF456 domain-containing protein [Thioalkalivibrio sp. XN279]
MTILLWIFAVLLTLAGLAGLVLPALPGPLLLFAGLFLGAWAEGFAHVGTTTLVLLAVMAGLAMLADFVAGAFGAKRYGASPRSVAGAAIGALIGIFFGLLGLLLGPFLGALVGEIAERKGWAQAGRAGLGATLGLVIGTAAKLALGFAMVGLFLLVRFL